MQSNDSFLLNAFLAFAAIYIAMALIRIVLQWKHSHSEGPDTAGQHNGRRVPFGCVAFHCSADSRVAAGYECVSHRSRQTLSRSPDDTFPTATWPRVPKRNILDVNEMIDVRLQRYFIEMQQFLRFLQRKTPNRYEGNQLSLGRDAQLRVPDMAPHHVEIGLRRS
jgi:hypothetical protein